MLEVFNKTVRGASHVSRDLPCQDWSISRSASRGTWQFVSVADGHGDPTCTRSDRGSRAAVDAAIRAFDELMRFAFDRGGFASVRTGYWMARENGRHAIRTMADELRGGTPGGEVMRALAERIVGLWYDDVTRAAADNPFSPEELVLMGLTPEEVAARPDVGIHAYGTTLMCCLVFDGKALLVQQGDGRCDVFFADGHVEQPIPWDDRCYDVYTTSLCDDDAARRVRTWVIDLQETPVAAIFMGTDGIEDSFATMEGTHCFYRKLAGTVTELGVGPELDEFLAGYLESLSSKGSADDMSVAGVVDLARLESLMPVFDQAVEAYDKELELERLERILQSKERKRDALEQRREELTQQAATARSAARAMDGLRKEYEGFAEQYNELVERRRELGEEIRTLRGGSSEDATLPLADESLYDRMEGFGPDVVGGGS